MSHMRRWRRERGAAAVEMALVLPLLLLLLFGIIDFGRLLYTKVELSSAARDGARVLALGKPLTDVTTRAKASYSFAPSTVTVSIVQSCPSSDETATVKVSTKFTWITPVGAIGDMFGGGGGGLSGATDVSSKGSMKCSL